MNKMTKRDPDQHEAKPDRFTNSIHCPACQGPLWTQSLPHGKANIPLLHKKLILDLKKQTPLPLQDFLNIKTEEIY